MNVQAAKARVREECKARLANLDFFSLIEKSSRLSDRFFSWSEHNASLFQNRAVVSFVPFGNEPQLNIEVESRTEPYQVAYVRIDDWKQGKMVAHFARRDTPDMWEETEYKGGVKIYEPMSRQPLCQTEDIAVILVPALGFTREGLRLGRGAGFYDRFLSLHPHALRLGIAFEEQVLSQLPVDSWDLPIDILLTDGNTYPMKSYGEFEKHGKLKRE